jgi:hypothetical protein
VINNVSFSYSFSSRHNRPLYHQKPRCQAKNVPYPF